MKLLYLNWEMKAMERYADRFKNYGGENPFSDSQGRNFSNKKIIKEFYPISLFWTVFNNQHEVLLGTRGSGKTFLLKMMRYSMLKHMQHPRAKKLVDEKEFIALYVPMHLERVTPIFAPHYSQVEQLERFQILFNISLCESVLVEVKSIVEDIEAPLERIKITLEILSKMHKIWFGEDSKDINTFEQIGEKLTYLYYNSDLQNIPLIFKSEICAPLIAIKKFVADLMNWDEEPTWIVCIDEAEFLNELSQKCINSVFRADSNRIALKVATLPFYHTTLDTLDPNVKVSEGNDFNYRVVDMAFEGRDFIEVTNRLIQNRLISKFEEIPCCESLEHFLGVIGNDDLIDYYKYECNDMEMSREKIEDGIVACFSEKKKVGSQRYKNRQKAIFDKYAPIYYVREMYKKSKKGHNVPGWFAGAKTVRKVAQGNPRIFLQIMNELFEKAKKNVLTPKAQHEVITHYCANFCEATKALEDQGPLISKELENISYMLHNKVHNGDLVSCSTSFYLKFKDKTALDQYRSWLSVAIAYSRIMVDDEIKKRGITLSTRFCIANIYAVTYWLPMRYDSPIAISLSDDIDNTYLVETEKQEEIYQYKLPLEELL